MEDLRLGYYELVGKTYDSGYYELVRKTYYVGYLS